MKHLPLNHNWQVLGSECVWWYDDLSFSTKTWETRLQLFCACGKVRTKRIAKFKMTEDQISKYVGEVYGIRLV